jgi:hypothetical protein
MTKQVIGGSTQHYGPRVAETELGYNHRPDGTLRQVVIPLDFENLPSADADRQDFPVIPANSIITRVVVQSASTTFVGGTSYNIGLSEADGGGVIDADGILAAVTLAQLNSGGTGLATEGALVGTTIGAEDAQVTAAATGTFTAGLTKIVIEYAPQS